MQEIQPNHPINTKLQSMKTIFHALLLALFTFGTACNSNKNKVQAMTTTYAEIKRQVLNRFNMLLSEKRLTRQEYITYSQTIIEDITFCANNTDTALIKNRLLSGLKKLKTAELDTEDREAIANWYLVLAQTVKIDMKGDLNKWLYNFAPE